MSAIFSSDSASHRTKIISWIRDLETCSRSFNHPLEPRCCAVKFTYPSQFAGDLHLASHTAQSLALPAHMSPVPSYCVCCGSWLISCVLLAVAVLRPTKPTALRNQSNHCAYLTVALANPLFTAQRSANIRLPTLRSHPGSPSITLYLSIRSSL